MARAHLVLLLTLGALACDGASRDSSAARDTPAQARADSVPRAEYELRAGTVLDASIQAPLTSRHNAAGERVSAIVTRNVMDGTHIVIPGGSVVVLTIGRLGAAKHPTDADGVIALEMTSLTVAGATYAPSATIGAVPHTLLGRAAGGAMTAAETDRDVIVTPGTPVTITLTHTLKIAAN